MRISRKYGWVLCLTAELWGSCQNGEIPAEGPNTQKPLEIAAEIKGAETAKSKTVIDDFGSYDSGAGFSDGDQMGFYSMRDENGNENNGYVNLPTRYVAAENCFKNEALIVDYPNNFGYTFGYYPYRAGNADNIDIYRPDGTVEDLLIAGTSQLSGGRIYLSFVHAFSMLIIVPGTGFEQAAEEAANTVRVVLEYGVKASVVRNTATGTIGLALSQDDTAPKEFVAQRRTNVMYAQEGEVIPVCYSVILPNGAEIDHIEMTDNHGTMQRVDPQIESLERSWRYPININMTGTTPTVWPYKIQPWITDEQPIELGGTYGINNTEDFQIWVTQYNRYTSGDLSTDEKEQVIEALKAFGEMTDGKWRFQINASIDCKNLFGTNSLSSLLTRLNDELNGRNHTLSNLDTPLAGSIGEGGKLTNLNIDAITITSENTTPIGALALEMDGGEITHCDIENIWIDTKGPVGALVGKAIAGIISENKVNGLLLGTESSSDGITGVRSGNVTCENNRSSALIF